MSSITQSRIRAPAVGSTRAVAIRNTIRLALAPIAVAALGAAALAPTTAFAAASFHRNPGYAVHHVVGRGSSIKREKHPKTYVRTPVSRKTYVRMPVTPKTYVRTPVTPKTYVRTPVIPRTYVRTPVIPKTYVTTPVIPKTYTPADTPVKPLPIIHNQAPHFTTSVDDCPGPACATLACLKRYDAEFTKVFIDLMGNEVCAAGAFATKVPPACKDYIQWMVDQYMGLTNACRVNPLDPVAVKCRIGIPPLDHSTLCIPSSMDPCVGTAYVDIIDNGYYIFGQNRDVPNYTRVISEMQWRLDLLNKCRGVRD